MIVPNVQRNSVQTSQGPGLELPSDYREPFKLLINRETVLQINAQWSLVVLFRPRSFPVPFRRISRRISFGYAQPFRTKNVTGGIEERSADALASVAWGDEKAHDRADMLRGIIYDDRVPTHIRKAGPWLSIAPSNNLTINIGQKTRGLSTLNPIGFFPPMNRPSVRPSIPGTASCFIEAAIAAGPVRKI